MGNVNDKGELSYGSELSLSKRITDLFQSPVNFNFIIDDVLGNSQIQRLENDTNSKFYSECIEREPQIEIDLGIRKSNSHKQGVSIRILTTDAEPDIIELQDRTLMGKSSSKIMCNAFKNYSSRPCLGTRSSAQTNTYEWISYKDVFERCANFSTGLRELLGAGEQFVGICGINSVEWLIADISCTLSAYVSVPIHHTFDHDAIIHIVSQTQMSAVITGNSHFTEIFKKISHMVPSLRYIIQIAEEPDAIYSFKQLEQRGAELLDHNVENFVRKTVEPNQIVTVVYTSGSTGTPKGVFFTEERWHAILVECEKHESRCFIPNVQISYQPLSHLTDRKHCWQGKHSIYKT
jgi:long-subunit acyl-CoA synthetase (AMP-forming)